MTDPVSPRLWLYGLGCVILGTTLFASKGIVIKLAYQEGITAIPLLTLRMLFALPFYLAMALWVQRKKPVPLTRRQHLTIIGLGMLSYGISSLLDFMGLQYITAGLERIILYVYPTLVLLMLAFWKKRPVTLQDKLALLIAYVGMLLVFVQDVRPGSDWQPIALGTLYVLGATLTFALFVVMAGDIIPVVGSTRFTALAMLSACVGVIFSGLVSGGTASLEQSSHLYWLVLILAFFCTVIPTFMMNKGIAIIGSGKTAMLGSFGPVVTLFLGAWILHEPMTLIQLGGAALVITGVSLAGRQNA